MINLETRKKLKELKIFSDNCCRHEKKTKIKKYPFYLLPEEQKPVSIGTCCKICEYFLPDPTLKKLEKAIRLKIDEWEDGGYQINYSYDNRINRGHYYGICLNSAPSKTKMIVDNELDECMAKALIWLYEQEK